MSSAQPAGPASRRVGRSTRSRTRECVTRIQNELGTPAMAHQTCVAATKDEIVANVERLLVAANTTGGVVGKMISPQNLVLAAAAVGLAGRESEILRKVLPWSIGLLIVLCLLVGLQSTPILSWMLP